MVDGKVSVVKKVEDIDLVEGRVEDIAPQGPAVVGDVMVAYHREEGEGDFLIGGAERVFVLVGVGHPFVLVFLVVILFHITEFGFFQQGVQGNVVLGLGIGYVSEVGVEEVVVLKADGQHLVHAAGVCGEVAVGPYQEGVVSFHGQIDLVVHVVLVKEVGHFYALFHRRSRHQDALGADFVPEFLTGGQGAQTREEDIEGNLLFHTTRHI